MNFSLEHFELHVPSELLPAGEGLYESDAITSSGELEKNLWSFEVKDNTEQEVEILISPSKVINHSCECELFAEAKVCKHIVAALYLLRNIKTKPNTVVRKTVRSTPKKLSTNTILQQIPIEDLKNFIRNYAKKNKPFSTALKANFARNVETSNNSDKYENILNTVIRPATGSSHRIPHNSLRQFFNIAEQFDAQFEDAISLKQYKEAFYIIKSLLSKNAYINHWTLSDNEKATKLNKHLHEQYVYFLEQDMAPELRREASVFSMELLERSYYHVSDPDHNMYLIILDANQEEDYEALVDILSKRLGSDLLHNYELEYLWMIRQQMVEKGIIDQIPTKPPFLGSQSVFRICEKLESIKAYKGLLAFVNQFKVKGVLKDVFLIKKYLNVLAQLGEHDELYELSFRYLFAFKDIFFYDVIRENFPNKQKETYTTINEKLSKRSQFEPQSLFLDILKKEHKVKEMVTYILSSDHSLTHLYNYADYISQSDQKELAELSVNAADMYLKEYLGEESAHEMRKLLLFLKHNDYNPSYKMVRNHLLSDFSDRKGLMKTIKEI